MREPTFPELTAAEIIEELERELSHAGDAAIAFDGDGTLWSGDVGEECFVAACLAGRLSPSLEPRLAREAEEFGIECSGTASERAWQLGEAYQAGRYPELRVCELMIWCYAGWTEAELAEHVRQTLAAKQSKVEVYEPLLPILSWARSRSIHCIVVSASPGLVVREAARPLGFSAEDIVAGYATVADGRLSDSLAGPVPYGETKVSTGRSRIGHRRWLASFGDNVFDVDMLNAARLPVAVRPKARLLAVLGEVARAAVFKAD
ncbi:MAG TPA: haloacid dehalogenase-like hydrolase [Polyangiaceae bacterium]|nr:haloacid dehalogenase-like hydrolase [Polyangiaceae bacterium]